jgi:hypothetical protein
MTLLLTLLRLVSFVNQLTFYTPCNKVYNEVSYVVLTLISSICDKKYIFDVFSFLSHLF